MIIFWTHNDQRKKRFLKTDVVECYTGFALINEVNFTAQLFHGRRKYVRFTALFDDKITPPMLLRMTQSSRWLAHKHSAFPAFYTDASGTIRRMSDNEPIMRGDEWNPPV